MSSNIYSVGLNHVGAYQVSGVPYLSGSNMPGDTTTSLRFQFPTVTKKIVFKSNYAHPIRIHFAPWQPGLFGYSDDASSSDNYFLLSGSATQEFEVKCREVFISSTNAAAGATNSDIQIYAELTNIPATRMFSLDGVDGVSS
jgi:hypothetical protein